MRAFFIGHVSAALLIATPAVGLAQAKDEEALVQPPKEECETPVPPTGALAPWVNPALMSSVKDPARLPDAQLRAGQAARLFLHPVGDVRYPVTPGKPGGNGGLAEVTIAEAGNYRVALGTAGWIDLVADGKALTSTAHGHGPKCTTIRKTVDFALKPGRYTVMISANLDQHAQVLMVKLPR